MSGHHLAQIRLLIIEIVVPLLALAALLAVLSAMFSGYAVAGMFLVVTSCTCGALLVRKWSRRDIYLFSSFRLTFVSVLLCFVVLTTDLLCGFAAIYCGTGVKKPTGEMISLHDFSTHLYFSGVTFTTLGYGDLLPTPASRPIAVMEAFTGYVYLGLFIASLQTGERKIS